MQSATAAAARRLLQELAAAPIDQRTCATLQRLIRAAAGGRPGVAILAEDGRSRRDDLLREIARQHFPNIAVTTAAKSISVELRRYASGRWIEDRKRKACPYPDDTMAACLFAILRLGEAVETIAVKTIARCIATASSVDTTPSSAVHGSGSR